MTIAAESKVAFQDASKLVRTIGGVLAHAIERGDRRSYESFDTDERWASVIAKARRSDDPAGAELRRLHFRYLQLRRRERIAGPGSALVLDHPFNVMLARKGLLQPRGPRRGR